MLVERFIEDCTITGLREAYKTKSWLLKFYWLLCIITGIALTCHFIVKILDEYGETQTATKTVYNNQATYDLPPVSICPPYWIDSEKIAATGLSPGAISYAFSFLMYVISEQQCDDITDEDKSEFQRYMKRHNIDDILQFYYKISYDVEEIVLKCPGCSNLTNDAKHFTDFGMCYILQFLPFENSLMTFDKSRLFYINNMEGVNWSSRFLSQSNTYRVIIDPDKRSIIVDKEYIIQINVENIVYVSYVIKEFLDQPNRPCLTTTEDDYSQQQCMIGCLQEYLLTACNMSCYLIGGFNGDNNDNETRPLCRRCKLRWGDPLNNTMMIRNEENCSQNIKIAANNCLTDCPSKCVQNNYQVTTVKYKKWFESIIDEEEEQKYTMISVVYEIGWNGIEIQKEYYTYSTETLISNVGGVLGLWVGASAMTLIQIFVFFVEMFVYQIRRHFSTKDERQQKITIFLPENITTNQSSSKSGKQLNRFY